MFADPNILDEIVHKRAFLEKKKKADLYALIETLFDGALEREALEHSLRIEYPLVRYDNKEVNRQLITELSENLKKAWDYGRKNFTVPFDKTFLINVANYVEPIVFQDNKDYRKMAVRPSGAKVTPPYPAKLDYSMNKFFGELSNLYQSCKKCGKEDICKNSIDIGSWIHLHLARIHPFEDGNGRTARLVQNLYLRHLDAFPPIVIYEGERKDYINHLDDAVFGYKDRDGDVNTYSREILSEGEKHYYDYMAGKLNVILDKLIEKN